MDILPTLPILVSLGVRVGSKHDLLTNREMVEVQAPLQMTRQDEPGHALFIFDEQVSLPLDHVIDLSTHQ
jgi:hypothetical protein